MKLVILGEDFILEKKSIKKKAFVDKEYCVACGICEKECPINAISIYKGIFSKVDIDKCVGCSKCVNICPASTIGIKEVILNEK